MLAVQDEAFTGVVRVASPRVSLKVRAVDVPMALLVSKGLTPAAKFLWIRMRLDELRQRTGEACVLPCLRHPHHPRRLVTRTSLARSTVYEAIRRLAALGWLVGRSAVKSGCAREGWWQTACPLVDRGATVWIPTDLIRFAHALRPQAILCFGLLQSVTDFSPATRTGTFSWSELKVLTGLDRRTLKRALRALADHHWVYLAQRSRSRTWFRLQHGDRALADELRERLDKAEYFGENLMRFFLTLIADTRESEDNARPEFLVNPATGERLEFDRYYPVQRVAFEFNGPQHYSAVGKFTEKEVAAQRKRDQVKRRICKERGIELVVVHASDLTLVGMLRRVGDRLPRRMLRGLKRTIRFLNRCGLRYQAAVAGA